MLITFNHRQKTRPYHAGFTLTELMIALVLSMLIVLAATALVISTKSAEANAADRLEMQDNADYALLNISNALQQAGYKNIDADNALSGEANDWSASIAGLDNSTLKATSAGISAPATSRNFFSDVLAIRYSGSGRPADNTILNCAGIGVAAGHPNDQERERGWSIYYVANDASGESNLYCKYQQDQFTAQSIAQGVESFQVLYGIDMGDPAHGATDRFLSASELNALDASLAPDELHRRTSWKKITAVKVALLMRGKSNQFNDGASAVFNLFGTDGASTKPGAIITQAEIAPALRSRLRLVISRTIALRNPLQ